MATIILFVHFLVVPPSEHPAMPFLGARSPLGPQFMVDWIPIAFLVQGGCLRHPPWRSGHTLGACRPCQARCDCAAGRVYGRFLDRVGAPDLWLRLVFLLWLRWHRIVALVPRWLLVERPYTIYQRADAAAAAAAGAAAAAMPEASFSSRLGQVHLVHAGWG